MEEHETLIRVNQIQMLATKSCFEPVVDRTFSIHWTPVCNFQQKKLRACLHGGGGPQVGEVTRFGGVTRLSN